MASTNLERYGSIDVSCRLCGRHFRSAPSRIVKGRSIYCSRRCRDAARASAARGRKGISRFGPQNPNWRGVRAERPCPVCGVVFAKATLTCSDKCGHEVQRRKITTDGNGNWTSMERHLVRNYRSLISTEKCSVCSETRRVIAHHIDGDRSHNVEANLVALCHWCHTTVHFLAKQHKRGVSLIQLNGLVVSLCR
jgi:hypothetical protein